MEIKKYLLSFWISFILLIIVVLFSKNDFLFQKKSKEVIIDENENLVTTSPHYKSINVLYKDSIYQIFDVESYIDCILIRNGLSTKENMKNPFDGIVIIDSAVYNLVKQSIVIPHPQIDSIYNLKGLDYLLKMYFEDEDPRIPRKYKECDVISNKYELELHYMMNLLVRAGAIILQDCESGYPILVSVPR